MSETAIRVEGLGKQYRIGKVERYRTLRDTLADAATAPFRRVKSMLRASGNGEDDTPSETIWALKDVSFEVPRGAVVGVIGRNGAGKSTLLKVLSRITEPTEGHVEIHGRVGSLLEVGTGFHGELSGRENIFLNGAILGMRKAEIARKFDEIVAFAEVEKFIDTPVKHYSSGMYVRLAFAVAAHMEPDILIVDEVLSVGDRKFQQKCIGAMAGFARGGRTIILVSHDLAAVERLTHRSVLLDKGEVRMSSTTPHVIDHYLSSDTFRGSANGLNLSDWPQRNTTGDATFLSVATEAADGTPRETFRPGEPVIVSLEVQSLTKLALDVALVIETDREQALFATHCSDSSQLSEISGAMTYSVAINPNLLRQGTYLASAALFRPHSEYYYDLIYHFPLLSISGSDRKNGFPSDRRWGALYLPFEWSINESFNHIA